MINKYLTILVIILIANNQLARAEDNNDLPNFSLYNSPSQPSQSINSKKESPNSKQQQKQQASQSDQQTTLSVNDQNIPQYVLDMLKKQGTDINSVADKVSKLQILKDKELKRKQEEERKKEALRKKEEEKKLAIQKAAELKKKKEEEAALRKKMLMEDYRVFPHRPVYEQKTLSLPDPVHKKAYGPDNQHLAPFIDLNQYTRYLFLATLEEDLTAISDLLKKGANLNAQDVSKHYTPLMYAARLNKNKSAAYLISKGAHLNLRNKKGETALYIACSNRNASVVNSLLDMQADVEITDLKGNRPAIKFPDMPDYIARKFLNSYKNIDDCLMDFVKIGRANIVYEIIKQDHNINIQDEKGNTVLMWAIINKDPQLINFILREKPNYQLTNKFGETALDIARDTKDRHIWAIVKTYIDSQEISSPPYQYPADKFNIQNPKPISLLPNKKS